MEPKTAQEILAPLLGRAAAIALSAGGTPKQLELIEEALETLDFAISWAQLTWDQSFPAWLQHCAEEKNNNRPERRRLEVVRNENRRNACRLRKKSKDKQRITKITNGKAGWGIQKRDVDSKTAK
jgi:hypothetical protein